MRILMMSHGYPPTISGVSVVVQKVSRALVRKGHHVTVLTASDRGEPYYDEDEGVKLIRVRSLRNPFWADGPIPILGDGEAREIVSQYQPQIIHAHDGALLSHYLLSQAEKVNIPKLATCHFFPRFITQYINLVDSIESMLVSFAWDITLRLLNLFDHVVFPTRTQKELFLQHGLNIPSSIISNGVDRNRYKAFDPRDDKSKKNFICHPGPLILFVGRLARDKEIDILIRAMPPLWRQVRAKLLLVGKGNDRARLEQLTAKLNLTHCVHFLGFVPENELPSLYRMSDVFTICSTSEVQSIPTLQAVVSGLPIVAVRAGALPELVHDGLNGYLARPGDPHSIGDALLRILRNPGRAAQMGQESLKIGQAHDETATFQAYEQLYRSFSRIKLLSINFPVERVA